MSTTGCGGLRRLLAARVHPEASGAEVLPRNVYGCVCADSLSATKWVYSKAEWCRLSGAASGCAVTGGLRLVLCPLPLSLPFSGSLHNKISLSLFYQVTNSRSPAHLLFRDSREKKFLISSEGELVIRSSALYDTCARSGVRAGDNSSRQQPVALDAAAH